MVENSHRTESTLTFGKIYFGIQLGKQSVSWYSNALLVGSLDYITRLTIPVPMIKSRTFQLTTPQQETLLIETLMEQNQTNRLGET